MAGRAFEGFARRRVGRGASAQQSGRARGTWPGFEIAGSNPPGIQAL